MKKIYIIFLFQWFCEPLFSQTPVFIWEKQEQRSVGKLIRSNHDKNLVVCGTWGNDYLFDWVNIITLMYDTNGNEMWRHIYDDTINGGIDDPFDMVIDTFDNIYIAGRTHLTNDGLPITPEILLLKYDKYGNLIWKQEFGDSINFMGGAWKMQLFDNRTIYLAGYGQLISGSQNKSVILKYDSSGTLLWQHIDLNAYETMGLDVEIDKSENAYLIGTTACCTPGYKIFVTKYDSSGSMRWNKILFDSAHIYATAHYSGIDDSANIYITGNTQDTAFSTGYDCVIAKVDSAGQQKWFTVYTSSNDPNHWENSNDMTTDMSGNSYVCGSVSTGSGGYGFVLKILSDGSIAWDSAYSSTTGGFVSLFMNINSDLFITGGSGGSSTGLAVISFDSSGIENYHIQRIGTYSGIDLKQIGNSMYVTGRNSNVSSSQTDDSLFVFKLGDSTLINSASTFFIDDEIQIFPIPFQESLFIYPRISTSIKVKIYNLLGEILYDKTIKEFVAVNARHWTTGIYFISVQSGNELFIRKIIKSK